MTDSTSPAPAGGDDGSSSVADLRSFAAGMPDSTFGFDDDDAPASPGAAPSQGAEHGGEGQQATTEKPAPAEDGQPRDTNGRFSARDAQQAEGQGEPQEGQEPAPQQEGAPEAQPGQEEPAPEQEGKRLDFLEIDGRRYSPEDVQRGFMRQEDYSRKTQETARERQALQGQVQQLQGYEQQLSGILEIAVAALRESLPDRPGRDLLDNDPVAYQRQMLAHTEAVERLQAIAGHKQSLSQQESERARQQAEREAQQNNAGAQAHQQQQFALLQEKIPELRTEQGRGTFFQKAGQYASRYGLTPQELGQAALQDHRLALVLQDAMLGASVREQRPATTQALKAAPPIRPAARPGAGTREGQARREATRQFVENPTLKNALATGVMDGLIPDF